MPLPTISITASPVAQDDIAAGFLMSLYGEWIRITADNCSAVMFPQKIISTGADAAHAEDDDFSIARVDGLIIRMARFGFIGL